LIFEKVVETATRNKRQHVNLEEISVDIDGYKRVRMCRRGDGFTSMHTYGHHTWDGRWRGRNPVFSIQDMNYTAIECPNAHGIYR
jgi:hypothetical protein